MPRSRFRIPVAVASATALLCAAPLASAAVSGSVSSPARPLTGSSGLTRQFTLVTGDVAQLTTAHGTQNWQIEPTHGALDAGFQKLRIKGDTYVIPHDAMPYVGTGELDLGLFDVTKLARDGFDDASHPTLPLTLDYSNGTTTTISVPRASLATTWQRFTGNAAVAHVWPVATAAKSAPYVGGLTSIHAAGPLASSAAPKDTAMANVTINLVGRDGGPGILNGLAFLIDTDTGDSFFWFGQNPVQVPLGHYSVSVDQTDMPDPAGGVPADYSTVDPEVSITGDATLTFDARTAKQVTVDPKHAGAVQIAGSNAYAYQRVTAAGTFGADFSFLTPERIFTAATAPVTDGTVNFGTTWTFGVNPLSIRVGSLDLGPVQYSQFSRRYNGDSTATLIDAGLGSQADFAGLAVKGKIAVVTEDAGILPQDQEANAARAGAAGIFLVTGPGPAGVFDPANLIPSVGIPSTQGAALVALLANGPAVAHIHGVRQTPYKYELQFAESGTITAGAAYTANPAQLATVDDRFDYPTPGAQSGESAEGCAFSWDPFLDFFIWIDPLDLPSTQREYLTAGPGSQCVVLAGNNAIPGFWVRPDTHQQPGAHTVENWGHGPMGPGVTAAIGAPAGRTGDVFDFSEISDWNDQTHYSFAHDGPDPSATLSRDGTQIATGDSFATPWNAVADPTPATYQLTYDVRRTVPGWITSTATHTVWTFKSATTTATTPVPLLGLTYDVPVDQEQRAPAGWGLPISFTTTGLPGGASAAGAKAWASFDDGTTWTALQVQQIGPDSFGALVVNPPAGTGNGFVSLRVQASDSAGDQVDQTMLRSYLLHR